MGVTIHFEGKLKKHTDFQKVLKIASDFVQNNFMEFQIFEEPYKLLERVKSEKEWNYQGLTRGIKIQPHINSDPLWIEFDKEYYIQEYCKTQFANPGVHIKIVELLKKMEPYFQDWIVVDEGEYWESGDSTLLQDHLDDCLQAIEDAKKENPKLSGPFRISDGRIVDLMEQD